MKYTTAWLIDSLNRGENFKYIYFWGHQPSKSGEIIASCFSQWWKSSFKVNGFVYPTAEHWMMAQKALLFDDKENFKTILEAQSPGAVKALGRQVKNFENELWEEKRYEIVLKGNFYKFAQNPELKEFLIKTGDRVIVEASPLDSIWGVGLAADDERVNDPNSWQGLNLLGFALMEVRDMLM
ncbi:NADAR family protein [Desertivirga arenae]|uniref:NADAR family protein n=1 Tax=Desertivirga arenae TaxID=2810309 RepID=UPI001A97B715|nr:NADAR family protein [Pedobacter sp. SYSU D00823]